MLDQKTKAHLVSQHINIVGHLDDKTLIDQNSQLIRLFELEGIDPISRSNEELDQAKNRLNTFLKTLSSEYALYTWVIREKVTDFPEGEFKQPFAKKVNERYQATFEKRPLFQNKIVLGLVIKKPSDSLQKFSHFLKNLSLNAHQTTQRQLITQKQEKLNQVSDHLLSCLKDYKIKVLGLKKTKDYSISEPLSFMDRLLNSTPFNVPLSESDSSHSLLRNRSFFNRKSGVIEIQEGCGKKRFAAMLSIKQYGHTTQAGLLNALYAHPFEIIVTQSFYFLDPQNAKMKIKDQASDLKQAKDEALSQQEALVEVLDQIASGEIGQGHHHLSVMCFAEAEDLLNDYTSDIISTFAKQDIICIRETLFSEMTFWAQLPGNTAYIPRQALISTQNLSGFLSFHNFNKGQIAENHWGPAVTLLETIHQSPYYFNFHFKDVGNTLCFGSMGSGKTTLIGFLLLQSLKFGEKRIVFDKDRGLEILVRALGGHYERLKPGEPTGFNPCQLSDTKENRAFLNDLFKKLLTSENNSWSEADTTLLNKAVDGLYTLPFEDRKLSHFAPLLGATAPGNLRSRLIPWIEGGEYDWVFDHDQDQLELEPDILGFDLSFILDNETIKTPVLMYLIHRVSQAIENVRGGIFIDEGWKALSDPYFKTIIEDLGRTPRKKNNFLCLATQSTEDTTKSALSEVLNQSASCKLFFPNPQAKPDIYIQKLGLSEKEYDLVKNLDASQHQFLLNFGHGETSTVLRLNLKGLEDVIDVISGREETVQLLDQIRTEVADDPQKWLPIFCERLKKMREAK